MFSRGKRGDMNTKDYIYLDEDLLNSHLAQFEKGLLIKETSEHGLESSDSTNGSMTADAGVNGIFGLGLKLQNQVSEGDSSTESEFTKNIVENVLSDYAVDLLMQDCADNGVLHSFNSASEGDFISHKSAFQIYDFEYLKSIIDLDCLKPILDADAPPQSPGVQASKGEKAKYKLALDGHRAKIKSAETTFKTLYNFSSFADRLLADSVLIKVNGGIVICKRNKLRLNKAQVSFENESSRKIKIFGVISVVKKETHPSGEFTPFNLNQLDRVSSVLFDVTLSTFDMLHDNDKIIKPIAIYFEAD